MKIAIAQLYTKHFDDWAHIPIKNKQVYCNKHGYDLVTRRDVYKTNFDTRHPSWHSVLLILEILETTNVDWVFWSDIDALIMDQTIPLEGFTKPGYDIVIPSQGKGRYCNMPTNNCLCCGHYFIRNTKWSKDFLRHLWDWPKGEYEKYKTDIYWEQCGMNYMRDKNEMDFDKHVYTQEQNRAFNSFYFMDNQKNSIDFLEWGESWIRVRDCDDVIKFKGSSYHEGDFIVHFAGSHCAPHRKRLMEKYSEKVKWN